MMRISLVKPLVLAVCLSAAPWGTAQDSSWTRLGSVTFDTTCAPEVEQDFNRAVALYHSFALREAINAFGAIAETDASCGMAYWGQAMATLSNPFTWSSLTAQRLEQVSPLLDQARSAGLGSPREEG